MMKVRRMDLTPPWSLSEESKPFMDCTLLLKSMGGRLGLLGEGLWRLFLPLCTVVGGARDSFLGLEGSTKDVAKPGCRSYRTRSKDEL